MEEEARIERQGEAKKHTNAHTHSVHILQENMRRRSEKKNSKPLSMTQFT